MLTARYSNPKGEGVGGGYFPPPALPFGREIFENLVYENGIGFFAHPKMK